MGFTTQALQGIFDVGWNVLANSGAVWSAGAFLVCAVVRARERVAALAGVVVLLGALVSYYVSAQVIHGFPPGTSIAAVWVVVALIAGPVFGVAGNWWRETVDWRHIVALALLGGVLIGEGVYLLVEVRTQGNAGWVEIVVGVLVPLLLGKTKRARVAALLLVIVVAVAAYLGYLVLDLALARA